MTESHSEGAGCFQPVRVEGHGLRELLGEPPRAGGAGRSRERAGLSAGELAVALAGRLLPVFGALVFVAFAGWVVTASRSSQTASTQMAVLLASSGGLLVWLLGCAHLRLQRECRLRGQLEWGRVLGERAGRLELELEGGERVLLWREPYPLVDAHGRFAVLIRRRKRKSLLTGRRLVARPVTFYLLTHELRLSRPRVEGALDARDLLRLGEVWGPAVGHPLLTRLALDPKREGTVRVTALRWLVAHGAEARVRPLVDRVLDEDMHTELQLVAVGALGRWQQLDDEDRLKAIVDDRDPRIASAIGSALASIGRKTAARRAVRLLHGRAFEVRLAAAEALGQLGTESALEFLDDRALRCRRGSPLRRALDDAAAAIRERQLRSTGGSLSIAEAPLPEGRLALAEAR